MQFTFHRKGPVISLPPQANRRKAVSNVEGKCRDAVLQPPVVTSRAMADAASASWCRGRLIARAVRSYYGACKLAENESAKHRSGRDAGGLPIAEAPLCDSTIMVLRLRPPRWRSAGRSF